MKPISVIVIGAGARGTKYATCMAALPEKYRIVGVAEAEKPRRENLQKMFGLSDDVCFRSWEEILARPKMADMAIIATMDDMHYAPAMKAIELGYHLLLEKPVAPTAQQCADIALAAKRKGVSVLVCHVLRYTPFYKKIKQLLMSDTIGQVMSVVAVEGVGNEHQSHSYIRGNWHSEEETSPMLLAKSCHDLDMIQWLLDKPCRRVQSFGSLTYFRPENAPAGAPLRCADGTCPASASCPYDCRKLYLGENAVDWFRNAAGKGFTSGVVPTDEEILESLKVTDYGLCVFHANNDVVDHQVVNMEFDGGATVSFSMNAFNKGGRYIRLFGTKGEIYANMSDSEITVYTFEDRTARHIPVTETEESIRGGHGGGDEGIIRELYDYLSGCYNGFCAADIQISVKNHLIGFAAEDARHKGTVEDVDAFLQKYGMSND